jgi:hypothetical protein
VRGEPADEIVDLSELLDKSESRRKMLLIGGCLVLLAEAVVGFFLHRSFIPPAHSERTGATDKSDARAASPPVDAGAPSRDTLSRKAADPDAAPPKRQPDSAPPAPDTKAPPDLKAPPDQKVMPAKTMQPTRPPSHKRPRPKKKLFKIPY